MVVDVSLRFLLNAPIEGTIEYVTYWWMPVLVFSALAVTQRKQENIDLPMLHERLSLGMQSVSTLIAHTVTIGFVAIIGWYGFENALLQTAAGEFTPATNTLVWPTRWIVPLGVAVLVLQFLVHVKQIIQLRSAGDRSPGSIQGEAQS
jgi:TRAP-type C4-dicarboxylate transport system permease small subunit